MPQVRTQPWDNWNVQHVIAGTSALKALQFRKNVQQELILLNLANRFAKLAMKAFSAPKRRQIHRFVLEEHMHQLVRRSVQSALLALFV